MVVDGSGGMGRVICERLAEAGSDVVLSYQRNAARAAEVADAVTFLASSKAGYTTGQIIAVDGGYGV
jgi:NAD(P)-dependent dehydrogenase (short-subunit alcohol dehydrogenase family)